MRLVIVSLAAGVVLLAAFAWEEARSRAPMMPLEAVPLAHASAA